MVAVPAAVIFVNNDLLDQPRDWIVNQLHISEYMDGNTFDQRVAANPEYVDEIKQLDQRLLVIRDMRDHTNRSLADVVIFVKAGMASVLQNKFGPPGQTYKVFNLYWGQLCIY